ncbi:MAG: hypothetical protein ACM3PW_00480, partial [Chlamydiota bacterium]
MKRAGVGSWRGVAALTGLLLAVTLIASAQENGAHSGAAAQKSAHQQKAATARAGENSGSSFGQELAEASREAEGEGAKEENGQFKFSPSVRWIGKELGLGVHGAYWLAFILNFAALALLIYLVSRSRIPAMFRSRTATIRR